MPKITRISETEISYVCVCGRKINLILPPGEKVEKLIKCFECGKKKIAVNDADI
jgi:DNA-directed RNA polymerase subunit RPC12/RpoP